MLIGKGIMDIELMLGIIKFKDHFLTRRQIFSEIAFLKKDHIIS